MRFVTPFLTAAGLALSLWTSAAGAEEPKVGEAAPDFELKASDGKTYKLSDFKGKKAVVVAWFPKAFTGGCTAECKTLKENGKALREYNVAYFTASCDPVERNTDFAKSLDLDYPILSDPSREVAMKYGVAADANANAKRWTYIIGADGKLLHVEKMVKAGEHAKQLLDLMAKLEIEKAKK